MSRQAHFLEELIAAYTRRTAESKAAAVLHRRRIANGNFFFRPPLAPFKELIYPLVVRESAGAEIVDVDGNRYVDFCMGWGAHLFGFRPPELAAALAAQLERGWHIGVQAEQAAAAASDFCRVTRAERVFFSNTGTEAVLTALRLARAAVGRERVAVFAGSYHGHADAFLLSGDGSGPAAPALPGVPASAAHDALLLRFGHEDALAQIARHGDSLAAILVDPIPATAGPIPAREFLRELRRLADATGAALVLDEVLTGLRLGARGAQGYYGVEADLAAYGKVLGGGIPLAAVGGRARFLDRVDGGHWEYGDGSGPRVAPTLASGTFCRHPLGMAAARAVLGMIEARGTALYAELERRSAALAAALAACGEPDELAVERTGSVLSIEVTLGPLSPAVPYLLALRGVHAPRGDYFVSDAHTDEHVARFAGALREALAAVRAGAAPAIAAAAAAAAGGGR